jgi:nucleotide-binding universal stress UspA family protein
VAVDQLLPDDPLSAVPAEELTDIENAPTDLRNAGVSAEGEIVNAAEHDIAEIILRRATDLDVQLVVLGEGLHGRKFLREGVTDSLLRHHRPCSVLLVRCA